MLRLFPLLLFLPLFLKKNRKRWTEEGGPDHAALFFHPKQMREGKRSIVKNIGSLKNKKKVKGDREPRILVRKRMRASQDVLSKVPSKVFIQKEVCSLHHLLPIKADCMDPEASHLLTPHTLSLSLSPLSLSVSFPQC